jgi:hypothetical protein
VSYSGDWPFYPTQAQDWAFPADSESGHASETKEDRGTLCDLADTQSCSGSLLTCTAMLGVWWKSRHLQDTAAAGARRTGSVMLQSLNR